MKTKHQIKRKQAPAEIIAICERPGYLDHIERGTIRVLVELYDEKRGRWQRLTEDIGNEIWLLEYPPHSRMAHYCLQGKGE